MASAALGSRLSGQLSIAPFSIAPFKSAAARVWSGSSALVSQIRVTPLAQHSRPVFGRTDEQPSR
jgi:hypothetical protein